VPSRRLTAGPGSGNTTPAIMCLLGLRLARVDRHLTDHHGLLGPAVVVPVLLVNDDRLHKYYTRHVQPLGNFSENRVVAVEARGLAQGNVETAGRGVRLDAVAGADCALLMGHPGAVSGELGLEPVADVAVAPFAGAQGAAGLDLVQPRAGLVLGLFV